MKFRYLIVPDGKVTYARELSAAVAGTSGDGMYTTPLSPTGQEPATHWISAGNQRHGNMAQRKDEGLLK